jgi:hypothetical protein
MTHKISEYGEDSGDRVEQNNYCISIFDKITKYKKQQVKRPVGSLDKGYFVFALNSDSSTVSTD